MKLKVVQLPPADMKAQDRDWQAVTRRLYKKE